MDLSRELTVCICTRDRPRALRAALGSVREQAPAAPIVVADDGTASAEELCRSFAGCEWHRGPRRGLGANRNVVVAAARTPWVLFLDDDARLGAGFLGAVEARLAGLTGPARARTIVSGRELNRGRLVSPHDVDFLGFQRVDYDPGERLRTVVINATVWPREVFDRVAFDEALRYGSDEVDISYAALAAGYRIEFCPEAVNDHEPDLGGRESYAESAHASRLRATTKRYWRLRRSRLRACLFLVLGPAHLALASVRREGLEGLVTSARILRRWLAT